MAIGDSIQRHPLLRLLVFYVGGIFLADRVYPYVPSLPLWGVWGTLALLAMLLLGWLWGRKAFYGLVASALMLLLGIWNYSWIRSELGYQWSSEEVLYEARVVAEPRDRQRSVLCEVEVTAVYDSLSWHRVGRKVFAYMAPCAEVETLLPGDMLCFKGKVRAPHNFSDNLSFDYARYVTMRGVSGTIYLPREHWRRAGEFRLTWREQMLRLRGRLLQEYMAPTFDEEVLGVLSALTLGDKRGLSKEVRAAYSDAGASHMLALSGLHVGVIYGLLAMGLRGLMRRRNLRWLRELLIVTVLWGFALLVGMSASVVRAVAMCTLYIFARWMSDDTSSPLHILTLTALLMLLVRPLYLFDIGFQLSFMAMASILWLEPKLELFFRRHSLHPIPGFFVGLLCMSFSAQLGTFPLVLYHFGAFPSYFLLTNLLVVPCLSVVLLLSLVWWPLLLLGIPGTSLLSVLLHCVVGWMNQVLSAIAQWPGAVLHVQGYNAFSVAFTYLFILFVGLFVTKKWPRAVVFALAALLGLLVSLF